MICAKRIDGGVAGARTLELRLAVHGEGTMELEIFASLHVPMVGIDNDQGIVTNFLTIAAESPAALCASAINKGNKTLLQALKRELLKGFPRPCKCPRDNECKGLGDAEYLQRALETVWGAAQK